jgi:hypothetical protein
MNLLDAKLVKAYLRLHKPGAGGKSLGAQIDTIDFSFNPKEFTVERQADWKSSTSKKPAPPEYNGVRPGSMTLELFVDHDTDSIKPTVDRLLDAVLPVKGSNDKKKPVAPFIVFGWGRNSYITGVARSINARYTRFAQDGSPLRAVVTLSLEEVLLDKAPPRQNPTSGAVEAYASRVLRNGDTLAGVANQELGSPTAWRQIAEANGIDDPFRLRRGQALIIPHGR